MLTEKHPKLILGSPGVGVPHRNEQQPATKSGQGSKEEKLAKARATIEERLRAVMGETPTDPGPAERRL